MRRTNVSKPPSPSNPPLPFPTPFDIPGEDEGARGAAVFQGHVLRGTAAALQARVRRDLPPRPTMTLMTEGRGGEIYTTTIESPRGRTERRLLLFFLEPSP
jgi:hypothetical protein